MGEPDIGYIGYIGYSGYSGGAGHRVGAQRDTRSGQWGSRQRRVARAAGSGPRAEGRGPRYPLTDEAKDDVRSMRHVCDGRYGRDAVPAGR